MLVGEAVMVVGAVLDDEVPEELEGAAVVVADCPGDIGVVTVVESVEDVAVAWVIWYARYVTAVVSQPYERNDCVGANVVPEYSSNAEQNGVLLGLSTC